MSGTPTLSVCVRCRSPNEAGDDADRPGARLARAIERDLACRDVAAMRLREIRCMSQFERACVVAISSDSRFTYLVGDLEPARDAAAVVDAFRLYASRPDGFMERHERPLALKSSGLWQPIRG